MVRVLNLLTPTLAELADAGKVSQYDK